MSIFLRNFADSELRGGLNRSVRRHEGHGQLESRVACFGFCFGPIISARSILLYKTWFLLDPQCC